MQTIFKGILVMGIFFNTGYGCSSQDKPAQQDRKPVVAGRFYPSDPKELRATLQELFSKAKPAGSGDVAAIIAPHAGYIFSGEVAANSYIQIDPDKSFDNIFIIASSHQVSFNGASVYNRGDYVTPLGKVKVNTSLADLLIRNHPVFVFNPEADRNEHSLEVQVPFLQYHMKKEITLVPIVIGTQSEQACKKIAEALQPYFNERNLFVFSTDFSHYPAYDDARKVDQATCDAIVSGDPKRLSEFLRDYESKKIPNLVTNLCGWTSIMTLLYMTESSGGCKIKPVRYLNSGDGPYGDKNQVVGYWSIVVNREKTGNPESGFSFSRSDQAVLLKTARETLEKYLKDRKMPDFDAGSFPKTLNIHAGAFVTLKEHGSLRGCIGRFSSNLPLWRLISELSVSSATEDNRFEPVAASELNKLQIEISVLSPMRKISSPNEIILGKHGIYIKKGYYSGTFLPQVATETGWEVEEFLGHCARDKAGIGWDGWKTAELYTYEAFVFGED